jgi:hypothetical protein
MDDGWEERMAQRTRERRLVQEAEDVLQVSANLVSQQDFEEVWYELGHSVLPSQAWYWKGWSHS